MSMAINLALLILGTTGALAAFGGETWVKGDAPIAQRVTRRGRLALFCMLITLILGVVKEVRSSYLSSQADAREAVLQEKFEKATVELKETRKKLAAVEPNLLRALVVSTAGIRRESDFSTTSISGEPRVVLRSTPTGRNLKLYGGDYIDYNIYCNAGDRRFDGLRDSSNRGPLLLNIGNTQYRLEEHGRRMIIGPVGMPMEARLVNRAGINGCTLKILVDSADRTREFAKLEPLIKMIEQAQNTNP